MTVMHVYITVNIAMLKRSSFWFQGFFQNNKNKTVHDLGSHCPDRRDPGDRWKMWSFQYGHCTGPQTGSSNETERRETFPGATQEGIQKDVE